MADTTCLPFHYGGQAVAAADRDHALLSFLGRRDESAETEAVRRHAWRRFTGMGWPTPEEEEWRRTDLSGLDLDRYHPHVDSGPVARARATEKDPLEDRESRAGRIAFEGSHCLRSELRKDLRERGVLLAPLDRAAGASDPEGGAGAGSVAGRLNRLLRDGAAGADNRLQALNYSLWSHGVFLYVPPFVEVDEPFRFDFREVSDGACRGSLSSPHVVVLLDQGARAVIVHRTLGGDEEGILCNGALDIEVGEAAGLDYYTLQDLNSRSLFFSHGRAQVARDGTLHHFEAAFGGRVAKSRFESRLAGRGAHVRLDGVYFARESQHMDLRSVQVHEAPRAGSRAFYKGAVKGGARTIFQGLIQVGPEAAGTDAYLTNKNLILNDGARADSIPSLKIDTNDVKCSHGSTTGRIDTEKVFYLMSRGLGPEEARRLLVLGHFEELLRDTPPPFGDDVRQRIVEHLST